MNKEITRRHNERVGPNDTVWHLGDIAFKNPDKYLDMLNGKHMLIPGNHGTPGIKQAFDKIYEIKVEGQLIVLCHYAMRVWNKSHYNSWQLYGHSHGNLPPLGKQMDVGVDTHDFYPYSFEEVKALMDAAPDNFNFVGNKKV